MTDRDKYKRPKDDMMLVTTNSGVTHLYNRNAAYSIAGEQIGALSMRVTVPVKPGESVDAMTCKNCITAYTEGPDALPWGRRI